MSPIWSLRVAARGPRHRSTPASSSRRARKRSRAKAASRPDAARATSPSIVPVSQSPAGVSLLISRSFQRPAVVHAQSKRERKLRVFRPRRRGAERGERLGDAEDPSSSGRWRRCASTRPDGQTHHESGVAQLVPRGGRERDRREAEVGEAVGPAVGVATERLAVGDRPPCRTHVVTTRVALGLEHLRSHGMLAAQSKRRPPPAAVVGERCRLEARAQAGEPAGGEIDTPVDVTRTASGGRREPASPWRHEGLDDPVVRARGGGGQRGLPFLDAETSAPSVTRSE